MEKEEIMELGHEPTPGYGLVYYAVIAIGIIYLAIAIITGKIELTDYEKNNHTKTESNKEH